VKAKYFMGLYPDFDPLSAAIKVARTVNRIRNRKRRKKLELTQKNKKKTFLTIL